MNNSYISWRTFLPALSRVLFPVSIVIVVGLLLILYAADKPLILLQGSYALFGLLLGAVIFYTFVGEGASKEPELQNMHPSMRDWAGKGAVVVLLLSVAYTVVTGERTLVLFIGIPLGYASLALQYVYNQSPSKLIPQIIGVFVLAPLTKYLTTEFYWGAGDLLNREAEIQKLISAGSLSGIDALYQFFPGLHLLTATVSFITGMPTHDSMLLAGILVYTAVILAVYSISRQVTRDQQLAIAISLGFTFSQPIHKYTTYFYSQSFAVALAVFALMLVFKRCKANSKSIDIALLILFAAITITHHLTLLLLAPIVTVVVLVGLFNSRDVVDATRFTMPFLILGVFAVGYWAYRGWAYWFIVQLLGAMIALITGAYGFLTPSSGESMGTALGTTVPTPTVESIIVYPPYLFYMVLLSLFTVGVAVALREYKKYLPFFSLIVTGILGGVLIFETPLAIKGLNRIRLPWSVPVAFIVGLGIVRLKRTDRSRFGRVLLVVLLVVTGTTGAMAAADDLGSFSQNPKVQSSYDGSEYEQMAASATFSTEYESKVTTLWIAKQTQESFGATAREPNNVTESGILVEEGLFLYRSQWTRHQVMYSVSTGELAPMYISDKYLEESVATDNKVYAAGQVGLTWGSGKRRFGT